MFSRILSKTSGFIKPWGQTKSYKVFTSAQRMHAKSAGFNRTRDMSLGLLGFGAIFVGSSYIMMASAEEEKLHTDVIADVEETVPDVDRKRGKGRGNIFHFLITSVGGKYKDIFF